MQTQTTRNNYHNFSRHIFGSVGCLFFAPIFLLILWLLVAWIIDRFLPQTVADAFYPIASKIDYAISIAYIGTFSVPLLVFAFLGLLVGLLSVVFRGNRARLVISTICAIYVICVGIAFIAGVLFLGTTYEDPNWIVLNRTDFSQHEVSITEGETMRFANPTTGTAQRLCLATDFECVRGVKGPRELQAPGVVIAPGQTLHISFPVVGDYQVIDVGRPGMVLNIRVDVPPPASGP